MILNSPDITTVTRSVKVYKLLLNAYPARFQQEYGGEMLQVFQDCCLRVLRQGGMNGMVKLWMVTLLDLIRSVISEHAQKEIEMKKEMKPEDIRRSGWALIWGAASFVLSIFITVPTGDNGFATLLFVFVCLPLLVYGVLGLRYRYGAQVGSFGRTILLIGAILGPLISLIGFFLLRVGRFWFITWTGHTALFTCLVLFGVVALPNKPMPRWNILPILAGLSYPLLWFSSTWNSHWVRVVTWKLTGHWYGISEVVIIILLLIQCIALAALGYILQSDAPQETAMPV